MFCCLVGNLSCSIFFDNEDIIEPCHLLSVGRDALKMALVKDANYVFNVFLTSKGIN